MSVEEMRLYKGRQEVPDNFLSFWKNELEKLPEKPSFKFVEKDFNLPNTQCLELTFESTLDSTIYSKVLIPESNKPVPVIFTFHGYQGQSKDWSSLLGFVQAGYAVVAMDVRGQAGQSIDGGSYIGNTVKGHVIRGVFQKPENLFYKEVFSDIYQLVNIMSQQTFVDSNEMYSHGHSQGGALALVAAALLPEIKKTVAIYPFLSDFKRVLELGNHSEAYDELFRLFKFKDPMHEREDEILNTLSFIDVKNFASMIEAEVLLITGLQDTVCPPSTQFAIYNRLNTRKEHIVLPEYGHDDVHLKIDDYVFNFLAETTIIN